MKRKLLVFGTSMFSEEIAEILNEEGYNVIGFVVDSSYKTCDTFHDIPVFEFETIEKEIDINSVEFVLSFGYSNMNVHRENKYKCCKNKDYKIFTFLSQRANIYTQKIGEGCLILPGTYVGPCSELGICNILRPGTVISHHATIGNFNWIADGCTFGGGVNMGNNCFLGLTSTIRNEITISDFTFSGAHSYLSKDTLQNSAYLGAPAKIVKDMSSQDIIKKV